MEQYESENLLKVNDWLYCGEIGAIVGSIPSDVALVSPDDFSFLQRNVGEKELNASIKPEYSNFPLILEPIYKIDSKFRYKIGKSGGEIKWKHFDVPGIVIGSLADFYLKVGDKVNLNFKAKEGKEKAEELFFESFNPNIDDKSRKK